MIMVFGSHTDISPLLSQIQRSILQFMLRGSSQSDSKNTDLLASLAVTITMISKIISRPDLVGPLYNQLAKSSTKSFLRSLSSVPIAVKVSPQEVASNSLTWQNLELATRALHRDGLVVLEDVIDRAKLDRLNRKMADDAHTLQSKGDASPFNYNKGCVGCSRRHNVPR